MIFLFILGIVFSLSAYFLTTNLSKKLRFLIALSIFLVMVILPIIFLGVIGDKPLAGARVVSKAEITNAVIDRHNYNQSFKSH